MKIRKSILRVLLVVAFGMLSVAFILMLNHITPTLNVFAEANSNVEVSAADAPIGETLQISGSTKVHRGETVTYTVRYQDPSATFLNCEVDRNDIATIGISTQGENCYYYPISISADAMPGVTFTITVTNLINREYVTLAVEIVPSYATAIGNVVAAVDGKVIGVDRNYAYPGDLVDVYIQNFETENGSVGDVTYGNCSLVLDSSSMQYAEINSPYTQISVREKQPIDNPVIQFTVVVMQPFAPAEFKNLQKRVDLEVYIPVESLTVEDDNRAVERNNTVECTVSYNGDNVASEKGFTHKLYDENNNPLNSSPYFEVNWNDCDVAETSVFSVKISKNAPYGSKLKMVLTSVADLSKQTTVELSVKELESGYRLKYSKDYQGNENPNNGIQLIEIDNTAQLRVNYNADIFFEGITTQNKYSAESLREYGVEVDFAGIANSRNFQIDKQGKIGILDGAPAYTNGNRTRYDYTVEVSDGIRNYSKMEKSVEVYIPIGSGGIQSVKLVSETSEVTANNNYMLDLSYDIVPVMLGTNFTPRLIDLTYTVSNSLFTITKDTANNKVLLSADNPNSMGNSTFTVTVKNGTLYNNVNIDKSWSKSLTLKRGFITTESHLSDIRLNRSGKYKLQGNIELNKNNDWVPIPSFSGTLDGNNYSILDIQMSVTSSTTRSLYGLFEENRGTIKNLRMNEGGFSLNTFNGQTYPEKIYCGFIAGKNYGTIQNCDVTGMFFGFAFISTETYAYVGSICGYNGNSGRVTSCSIFEAGMQIVTGAVGGVVGYNEKGTVEHCDIGLSSITCEDNYAGGIVGLNESGYVRYNKVINDQVTISWNGGSSDSRTLAPEMGIVVGRAIGGSGYIYGNTANGKVSTNGLQVITWKGGFLWLKTYTHDQAQYAKGEEVGRYI